MPLALAIRDELAAAGLTELAEQREPAFGTGDFHSSGLRMP